MVSFRARPLHTKDVHIRRDEVAAFRLEAVETGKSLLFWQPKRGSLSAPEGGHCNVTTELKSMAAERSFLKYIL